MNRNISIAILRGLGVALMCALILSFLAGLLWPEVTDPVNEEENTKSNIFGVILIISSLLIGSLESIRFFKNNR